MREWEKEWEWERERQRENCHQTCADDPFVGVKRCPIDNLDMDWFCVRLPFSKEVYATSNL